MKYRSVSAIPGIEFSVIGFGSWALGDTSGWHGSSDAESIATIHRALDCGVTLFDTAPVYGFGGSQRVLGQALKGQRDKITLASKCGLLWDDNKVIRRDLSAEAVRQDVETSLLRLQTDHLDLLQLHWPDHDTPLEETARALRDVIESGKVRMVGVTNFSIQDTEALAKLVPVVSYQGLYNLLERNPDSYHNITLEYRTEREILPYCREKGLAFLPYSPLFQGLLTGRFSVNSRFGSDDVRSANPKLTGPDFARYVQVCDELKGIAADAGLNLTHLALAWLCSDPTVTSVLCGAHRPAQIADNAAAADVELSAAIRVQIEELLIRNGL
jgi:aryl-alcohol dehydrogenase-like predicted oxidoreductase